MLYFLTSLAPSVILVPSNARCGVNCSRMSTRQNSCSRKPYHSRVRMVLYQRMDLRSLSVSLPCRSVPVSPKKNAYYSHSLRSKIFALICEQVSHTMKLDTWLLHSSARLFLLDTYIFSVRTNCTEVIDNVRALEQAL